jgi:hypothetical protein
MSSLIEGLLVGGSALETGEEIKAIEANARHGGSAVESKWCFRAFDASFELPEWTRDE